MRSYEAARSLYSFLGFLAWCAIVGGFIITIVGGDAANGVRRFGQTANGLAIFMGMIPGLAMMFLGFIALAIVQNGRAAVDTAEYTQQMLEISRSQLEVSRQALGTTFQPRAFSTTATKPTQQYSQSLVAARDGGPVGAQQSSSGSREKSLNNPEKEDRIIETRGHFIVDGRLFPTREDARAYVIANPETES